MQTYEEWANAWLGGMCAIGAGGEGSPIRHRDYVRGPWLQELLDLPSDELVDPPPADEVVQGWRAYLGAAKPVAVVKDQDTARKYLTQAAGLQEGERVALPVNASRTLAEAVKRVKGVPLFVELDASLEFRPETPNAAFASILWAQPPAGLPVPKPLPNTAYLVDYASSLPVPGAAARAPEHVAAVVWDLHLNDPDWNNGALVVFNDEGLARRFAPLVTDEDAPDWTRAWSQLQRLQGETGLAARVLKIYDDAHLGFEAAVGLPLAYQEESLSLPYGLAIRVPAEVDVQTFYAYAVAENVPLVWLPHLQPAYFFAFQVTRDLALTMESAANLSRWLISPLGPDFTEEEVRHAVLVVAKTADYLGVRWYTNPERAAWYGNLLVDWYGPSHDAFRPVVDLSSYGYPPVIDAVSVND
jgi:hypothetical protein